MALVFRPDAYRGGLASLRRSGTDCRCIRAVRVGGRRPFSTSRKVLSEIPSCAASVV